MTVVLSNYLLGVQLPQSSVMVGASSDQVCRVGGECAIPNPSLVSGQSTLEFEWLRSRDFGFIRLRLLGCCLTIIAYLPYLCGVVSTTCREMLDIGRQQDSSDIDRMRLEVRDRYQCCLVPELFEAPDEDVSLESSAIPEYSSLSRLQMSLTLLLPAHKRDPSVATVTLDTETSSSGMSWCEQLFSERSQMRTLPLRSQLMISP